MTSWKDRLLAPLRALMALPRRRREARARKALAEARQEIVDQEVARLMEPIRAAVRVEAEIMAAAREIPAPARGAPTGAKKPRGKTRKRSKGSSGTRARKTPSTR